MTARVFFGKPLLGFSLENPWVSDPLWSDFSPLRVLTKVGLLSDTALDLLRSQQLLVLHYSHLAASVHCCPGFLWKIIGSLTPFGRTLVLYGF